MPIKIGNINTTLLVDSGSACSILNRSLASQVVQSSPRAFWINATVSPQLRTFSNEPIQVEGKIQSPRTSKGRTCAAAIFTVLADGPKFLTGRDLFDKFGLAVTQSTSQKGNRVNKISSPEFKEQIAKTFPELISRIGRSKIIWQDLSFTKISNLDTRKLDVFQLTYKKMLILNLNNC